MEKKGVVGNDDYDRRVYVPLLRYFNTFAYARFGKDAVYLIWVSAEDRDQVPRVVSQVTNLLNERHDVRLGMSGFSLLTQDSIIEAEASTTEAFRSLLGWVAAISLS